MFTGHFKIEGHSNAKHSKAFVSAKKLQQKQMRTKGRVSSKKGWHKTDPAEIRQKRILKGLYLVVGLAILTFFIVSSSGIISKEVGRVEKNQAIEDYRIQQEQQEAIDFLLESGANHYNAGNWQEAIEEYQRVIAIRPNQVEAMEGIGKSREKLEKASTD